MQRVYYNVTMLMKQRKRKGIKLMKRFNAETEYTQETVHLLYKTSYGIYERRRALIRMGMGFLMAMAGLFLDLHMIFQAMLLMGGAWLMVSRDFPAKMRAVDALEKRQGNLPKLTVEFHDRHLMLHEGKGMKLHYKDAEFLVEDENMIFLFFSRDSAVLVEKKTIQGGSLEAFQAFLEEKTGRSFHRPQSWLQMSLRDVVKLFRKP